MKARLNRFAVFGLTTFGMLVVGCGGSGSGVGAGGTTAAVVSSKVSVSLPAGYKPVGSLSVSGGLFGTAPLTSGNTQANIKTWNTGSELVAVLDSTGKPVLLGWIGGGNTTINARTTADALTYFAIEGFGAPNENQAALITAISQQGGGTTVANDITADLASGKNLGSSGVSFAADLNSLALSLVGGSEPEVLHALTPTSQSNPNEKPATIAQISPDPTTTAGTQSGVLVSAGTPTDTLAVTNNFRRRVLLFIDRSDTFDGSNPPVKSYGAAIAVSENPISPAVGGVNGGTISGNLSGSIGATSSGPFALLPVPSGQFGADYDITAVGPGTANATPAYLSPSEVADAQTFLRRTFFTDFFLPVLNRICISNTLTQVQGNSSTATSIANAMDKAADAQSAGVDAFVTTNFSSALPQMTAGDFLGANASVLSAINSSGTTLQNVASYYSTFLSTVGQNFTPSQTNVTTVLNWMSTALANVNVANLPTNLPQYSAITQSQVYSTWTVSQTTGAVVTLSPATSSITTTVGSDTQALTASVNFGAAGQPAGSTLSYSWTTTGAHGDLVFPGNTGTTSLLNSTYSSTTYFANLANLSNSGSDTVTVTVNLTPAGGGTPKQIGTSTATVTVNGNGGGSGQLAMYALRSATGSVIHVTGGSWYLIDKTTNTFIVNDPSTTSNPVNSELFYNASSSQGINFLYFSNEPLDPTDSAYKAASPGDTVAVMFDCPFFDGQTSVGIDQDVHLYSPSGKDLGVVIPKFTSQVNGSDGQNYDGFLWLVERDVTLTG